MTNSKRWNSYFSIIILLVVSFGSQWSHSQTYTSKHLKLIPIEHASLILQTPEVSIAIDPTGNQQEHNQEFNYIIVTDIHGDHFNQETIKKLINSKTELIAPMAVYEKMDQELQAQTKVLNNFETYQSKDITVEAIPMYNLREEALNFHTKGRGNGYVITIDKQRVYISGDTEDIPEMRSLKGIDIALVCMNLPYTMTETSAASAVMEFKPKTIIPYHFRGRPQVSNIDLFEGLITNPKIKVVRLDWYPSEDY